MTGTALTTVELVPAGIKAGTAHMAFPIYERIPRGCVSWPVMGDRHAPHLQDRDQALVDATDREIVWGEVYLVNQGVNAVLWEVCNENEKQRRQRDQPERPCAWLRPLNRPRTWEEVQRIIAETGGPDRLCPLHMSDGPILLDALRERIVGRVIGLYQHPGNWNG